MAFGTATVVLIISVSSMIERCLVTIPPTRPIFDQRSTVRHIMKNRQTATKSKLIERRNVNWLLILLVLSLDTRFEHT